MICRIDINGRKIWNDNENAFGTRPPSVDIDLLRDGDVFDTRTVDSASDGRFTFACLITGRNPEHRYVYRIAEPAPPAGYTTKIDGFNVTNTLIQFTINGVKTWADNHNAKGNRPASVTINLLRNSLPFNTLTLNSPPNTEDTATFSFTNVPFADAQGKPYIYTLTENPVEHYKTVINGFNITNEISTTEP